MFNVGFTINHPLDEIVKSLETMIVEKGFKIESIGKDGKDTTHIKAVNKSRLAVLKYQLKRTRNIDPEAQRVAIHASIVPDDDKDKETFVFISVYPIMEFYHLPEIPNITESEEERITDRKLSEGILNELAEAVNGSFSNVKENFRTLPMVRTYALPDSRRGLSRDNVQQTIIAILRNLKFEVIKTNESEYNLSLEIKAVNKSFLQTAFERIKNLSFSSFLQRAQRVTVLCTITKPKLGHDHNLAINVEMYPSMEILGKEEIPTITQNIDEQLTDSSLVTKLWEPFIKKMDENFGPYVVKDIE